MSKKTIHFQVSERKLLLRALDAFMVIFGLYWLGFFFDYTYLVIIWENHLAIGLLLLYITIFGTVFEIYNLQKASQLEATFRNVVFTVSISSLFYFLTPFLTPFLPEKRLQIIYFYITIIIFIFLWRIAYMTLIASPRFYKKVLLVGEVSYVESIVDALCTADPNYKIVGFVNCEFPKEERLRFKGIKQFQSTDLRKIIEEHQVSEVIVASYNSETISAEIYDELMILLERGFNIREYTQVYEEITRRVPIQFIGRDFYKYFPFSRSSQNTLYLFFLRVFDIIFSIVGLIIGLFLLPLVIIGNLIGNKGPLFYHQERVGQNGKLFKIVKLRSMVIDAEVDGAKWAKLNDTRITKFGMFLRRSRIDEIPQFINVLKNEMSIIGPRPERPIFVSELSRLIPFYETRHIVKPGLTGWAQVNMRYGASVEESLTKLQYDLYYIKHRGVFLDLNIVVKTLSTILYYRGQ